jgi:hypothetical protein
MSSRLSSPNHQAISQRGLWLLGPCSWSHVSSEEKESEAFHVHVQIVRPRVEIGYSLPIGYSAVTGNSSPWLAAHSDRFSWALCLSVILLINLIAWPLHCPVWANGPLIPNYTWIKLILSLFLYCCLCNAAPNYYSKIIPFPLTI